MWITVRYLSAESFKPSILTELLDVRGNHLNDHHSSRGDGTVTELVKLDEHSTNATAKSLLQVRTLREVRRW
ncbi:hypothetical protein [Streptosporangium subroseum]|uniref:hypothetical protein n=1 Tax=Streptosporangium subroseum TaxID=106412 RepID=UPI00308F37DF|nr:hypothetical protein OHB15_34325 [Streptosporangium subroseum]